MSGKYGVIYADPPWRYRLGKWVEGCADNHYSTMTLDDLKRLDVKSIAERNCALFLWAVSPQLPEALELISAWGFDYKTVAFVWEKQQKNGEPRWGLGHYTRGVCEMCLLGVRGSMPVSNKSVSQFVGSIRREHSRKPDEVRQRIEQLYPQQLKIELFARESAPGWDCWGDQVQSTEGVIL